MRERQGLLLIANVVSVDIMVISVREPISDPHLQVVDHGSDHG
jgi:hypothetical protein